MSLFHMVQYGRLDYPKGMPLPLIEVPGHFDIEPLQVTVPYSLHTEYSYGPRRFSSSAIHKYSAIPEAARQGVPQLWTSMEWSRSFALFISNLTQGAPAPSVIEIHPPFSDCVPSIEAFLDNYAVFEDVMQSLYPGVQIVLENRTGTQNPCGFLISKAADLSALADHAQRCDLNLKLALDIPQLLHAERAHTAAEIHAVLERLQRVRSRIGSIHLWGRKRQKNGRFTSHTGDLDSWLPEADAKAALLSGLHDLTDDQVIRWMVLEVNSGNIDLQSIIYDLTQSGFRFV